LWSLVLDRITKTRLSRGMRNRKFYARKKGYSE
jgi:hypothetical protein